MRTNAACLLVFLLASLVCLGQRNPTTDGKPSELTVSVKDEQGAVVGNAFVLVRADSLERENPVPFSSEIRTDSLGHWKRIIPRGFYDVFIASTGFAPYCQKLRVHDGKSATINVVLKLDKLMSQEYGDTFDDKALESPHQKK